MSGSVTEAAASSAQEEEEEEGTDAWEDWQADGAEDGDEEATSSLFDSTVLPSVEAALEYDSEKHGLDLRKLRVEGGLDDYSMIGCINFIRSEVAAGRDPRPALRHLRRASPVPWADERYLQPVLADDPLLCHDWQDEAQPSGSAVAAGGADASSRAAELAALREENEALRDALRRLSLQAAPAEVARGLQMGPDGIVGWAEDTHDAGATDGPAAGAAPAPLASAAASGAPGVEPAAAEAPGRSAAAADSPGSRATETFNPSLSRAGARPGARPLRSAAAQAADATYFDSYGYIDIHRTMLADKVRTEAYRRALEGNPGLLRGAAVLDVGCGTGILSMFAARAGAARVIAVEGSERMAATALDVIAANRLDAAAGGPIEVVVGRIEDLQSLPVDKVDVIVSEWMGYALFFEAMLDSVLHARDRWLRPGGALLPDRVSLHLAAAGAGVLDLAFWDNVQGFSYAPVCGALHADALSKALVAPVEPRDLLSAGACVAAFDLAAMAPADADFTAPFELPGAAGQAGGAGAASAPACADTQAQAAQAAVCHALVLWFDADFSARACAAAPVQLSTSPLEPQTHWAQTVLALRHPVTLGRTAGGGQGSGVPGGGTLHGRLSVARSPKHRSLDISLELPAQGGAPAQVMMYSVVMS